MSKQSMKNYVYFIDWGTDDLLLFKGFGKDKYIKDIKDMI